MTDASLDSTRIRSLDDELIRLALDGWKVEYRVTDQAVLSRSRSGPFWPHLILLIVTAGVWFLVAVPLALFASPDRCRVWVDADGRVLQREARADLQQRPVDSAGSAATR